MKLKQFMSGVGVTCLIFLMVGAAMYLQNETNDIVTFKDNHQLRKSNIKVNMFLPSNKLCIEKCTKQEIGKDKGYPCGKSYQVCCLGERNCKKGQLWDTCGEKINAFFCEG